MADFKTYLVAVGVTFMAGAVGFGAAYIKYKPTSVRVVELEGDSRQYLLFNNMLGERNGFLVEREEGIFKTLGQLQEEEAKTIESKIDALK